MFNRFYSNFSTPSENVEPILLLYWNDYFFSDAFQNDFDGFEKLMSYIYTIGFRSFIHVSDNPSALDNPRKSGHVNISKNGQFGTSSTQMHCLLMGALQSSLQPAA